MQCRSCVAYAYAAVSTVLSRTQYDIWSCKEPYDPPVTNATNNHAWLHHVIAQPEAITTDAATCTVVQNEPAPARHPAHKHRQCVSVCQL
jgi:hypothetical protein